MSQTNDNKDVTLAREYFHTGNSGLSVKIVRKANREDKVSVEFEIGAFGLIEGMIRYNGSQDYLGVSKKDLLKLSELFKQAADKL